MIDKGDARLISSMTGYGRGCFSSDGREMTVELKSVNHRYLDLGMRLPRHIGFLEDVFRAELSARLSRGHVDLFVATGIFATTPRAIVIDRSAAQPVSARSPRRGRTSGAIKRPSRDERGSGSRRSRRVEAENAREAGRRAWRRSHGARVAENSRPCARRKANASAPHLMQRADTVIA
jgi:hypothetical protein